MQTSCHGWTTGAAAAALPYLRDTFTDVSTGEVLALPASHGDFHRHPPPAWTGRFWTQAPGRRIVSGREHAIVIGPGKNAPAGRCFTPVTDRTTVKHRVHPDLTSSAADREQETDRLLAPGARRAGIGQTSAEPQTVLADPKGNEFCVVRPKQTLIR